MRFALSPIVLLALVTPARAQTTSLPEVRVPTAALAILDVDPSQQRALALTRAIHVLHSTVHEKVEDNPHGLLLATLLADLDRVEATAAKMPRGVDLAVGKIKGAKDVLKDAVEAVGLRLREKRGVFTVEVNKNLDASAGGRAVFGFFDHSTEFQMRIEQLTPPALVRWQCTGGSAPDWVGMTQEFILEPQDEEVLLKFCHDGWERGGDHCYFCNTTWGHLLVCLKDYAERGVKNPYFR